MGLAEVKADSDLISMIPGELPIIPINDGVVFPYMIIPLLITDEKLIRLIDESLESSKIVGVFTQVDREKPDPGSEDIYRTGCALLIQKMARFPVGHVRIIGQGLSRIEIGDFTDDEPFMRATVSVLEEPGVDSRKAKALMRNMVNAFNKIVDASESYPDELKNVVINVNNPGRLADLIAANLEMEILDRQKVLEIIDPVKRLEFIYAYMKDELEIEKLGEKIRKDVRKEMDREQREYYLRQKIKAIRKELGEDDLTLELEELDERIAASNLPDRVMGVARRELKRLKKMSTSSAEYTVARTYLDWILDLPWMSSSEDMLDIDRARRILNKDHYALDQVKERILEFLSVKKLKNSIKGSILCFVGPPGVGKTSLGRSIARAMGREFVRISLGGIKDEAEIRGHRRTYIGSLPGRIIQGIRTAGSNNPVFMLDEIDKLGSDFRGDPSAALLEVLDPEQNSYFEDNYINTPFDLSRVMFITTANINDTIPRPLLDRMEVLEIPGYITSEKIQIAKRFLIPRQLEESGIGKKKLVIKEDAIRSIIEKYTRESGVRNLERKIASIARKGARKIVEGGKGPYTVNSRNLPSYLGQSDFPVQEMLLKPEVGVSTGMAKSAAGGVVLFIEALRMRGSGKVKLTGHLGKVMIESAEAAMSFVKAHYKEEIVDEEFFENSDIHLHIPAGAVPKDGPSAGMAIASALASIALGRKVRNDIAMTGEITLTGKVLPVGAVRDKVIAAHRAGIKEIILPEFNRKDIEEIPAKIKRNIRFRFIKSLEKGISLALLDEGRSGFKRKGKRRRHA